MDTKAIEVSHGAIEVRPGYVMPQPANDGFLPTENIEKNVGGILHTWGGALWEIAKSAVSALEKAGIQADGYVTHGDSGILPLWRVDRDGESYYEYTQGGYYQVNDCVPRAVDGFLKMMGMGSLTKGDFEWFKNHSKVTTDGASKGVVLGITHGLVSVYSGLGIGRVYLPKGSPMQGEIQAFSVALGVNPLAIQDRSTTNSEFALLINANDRESQLLIQNSYRMEFVEEPPLPCIVMLNSAATVIKKEPSNNQFVNVGGVWSSTSYGVGHAEYLGPRDSIGGEWVIAFTIERDVEYAQPDLIKDYANAAMKEVQGPVKIKELSPWKSKIHGQTITKQVGSGTPTASKGGVVHIHTSSKSVQPSNDKQYTAEEYFEGYGVEGHCEQSQENCPYCGGVMFSYAGTNYCENCWFYKQNSDDNMGDTIDVITTDDLCPMCLAKIADGKCTECIFDSDLHKVSQVASCTIHETMVYMFTEPYCGYVCPYCLEASGQLLDDFIKEKRTCSTLEFDFDQLFEDVP